MRDSGSVKLSCALGAGHTKVTLVGLATFGLAVLVFGFALISFAAPALGICLALAFFQSGFGRFNGRQSGLSAFDLGGDVQVGLVLLGFIGAGSLLQERCNLCLELDLGALHACIAHGLVAAGIGLDLGAIHRNGAQLDQAHLARQSHHLDEQFGELGQVQGTEVADRAVRREVVGCQHPKGNVLMQLPGDLA